MSYYKQKYFKFLILIITLITLSCTGCVLFDDSGVAKKGQDLSKPKKVMFKGIWLSISGKEDSLKVYNGNKVIHTMPNVAFGSKGVGYKKQVGDSVTPEGVFKISWINKYSRFKLFFGINYPNNEYAKRGLKSKTINDFEYKKIIAANNKSLKPPQFTRLGGSIGIHGLGRADKFIHDRINWTSGCIALNNQQIVKLAKFIKLGTPVVIEK